MRAAKKDHKKERGKKRVKIKRGLRGSYNKKNKSEIFRRNTKSKNLIVEPVLLEDPIQCQFCKNSYKTNVSYALHSIT
ncbi:hypothetical protein NQ314_009257 [Rhamnusium bicolor]|uniref:Uncharacterized protein n=1 Tax=Rhamnusium bicolor TaxID=1586634 RepID=A0AAV8Y1P2_9CUCU|nr:hypothetical protein NQ314_009257 [Rhamnusium bicolor]